MWKVAGKRKIKFSIKLFETFRAIFKDQFKKKTFVLNNLQQNCKSPFKFFFFFIYQVLQSNYLTHFKDVYHPHGLITTTLGLNIPVDGRHFYEGVMRVRCVGNLSPAITQSQNGRESVLHRRLSSMDSREAMLLGK
jgi:hypothetical protein